ncbi:MAG: creatininase family protein [Acidobacteria bacterium]|nr:MAG: creatininase family protein [Acidobacteriota bacterium]REK11552.1 MAG: creatininase family protein [Acidobacteriota bacterium]
MRDLDLSRAVAVLPIGAVEAHGPHLPLVTDRIIARAMAERGAELLAARGFDPVVLPAIEYTPAPFAAAFPGTVSIRPATLVALLEDIAASLAQQGVGTLVLANAHLDPAHLGALYEAQRRIEDRDEQPQGSRRTVCVFPDVSRSPWAQRLGDEFRSGACHAGSYETSIVQAAASELVHDALRRELEPNPSSLSEAIRAGLTTFEQAGGPEAYFGDPAAATPDEGRQHVEALGQILCEAVLAAFHDSER